MTDISEGQADMELGASVYIIMGPPNAGKDTQAKRLADKMGGVCIGSGDLMRKEADPEIMAIMARGELVSSADFQRLMGKAIARVPRAIPIVLAGIAKKPAEARWIVEYLPTLGRRVEKVLLLSISMEEAMRRSQVRGAQRADDSEHVQEVRWRRFYEMTRQSLEYFRSFNLLYEVDAEGARDEVSARVDGVIGIAA